MVTVIMIFIWERLLLSWFHGGFAKRPFRKKREAKNEMKKKHIEFAIRREMNPIWLNVKPACHVLVCWANTMTQRKHTFAGRFKLPPLNADRQQMFWTWRDDCAKFMNKRNLTRTACFFSSIRVRKNSSSISSRIARLCLALDKIHRIWSLCDHIGGRSLIACNSLKFSRLMRLIELHIITERLPITARCVCVA